MVLLYRVSLEPDNNGSLLVTSSLPEVTTFDQNQADAMKHARRTIAEALAARMRDRENISI